MYSNTSERRKMIKWRNRKINSIAEMLLYSLQPSRIYVVLFITTQSKRRCIIHYNPVEAMLYSLLLGDKKTKHISSL
jgi:hypothetical protein